MVLDQGKKKYPNPTTIIESLVADGADHNDANQDGLTCLMYAARNGNLETICSGCQALKNLLVCERPAEGVPNSRRSGCLLYTSPSPRDGLLSRMPSSA